MAWALWTLGLSAPVALALVAGLGYWLGRRSQTVGTTNFGEARTDALTGLGNRRALDEALAKHFALHARYQQPFAVVLLDIDYFKAVNDKHGHVHGDEVLQSIARHVQACARETDVVTRFGGDEFVVLLPITLSAGASQFADRVRRTLISQVPLTLSGGVADVTDGDTAATLLGRADAALYAAKAAGRNRIFSHHGQQPLETAPTTASQPSGVPAPLGPGMHQVRKVT